MDTKKALIGLLLAALMILPVAAPFTSVAHADTYPENVSGNVIKIGMTISLSGKFDEEGKQALCGIKAAIDWYNNNGGIEVGGQTYKLQLVYYDDTSDKNQVTSLYSRLIDQDQVDFLLAPYSSGLTAAAAGVANDKHVLMLSHGGASDSIFEQGYQYVVQVLSPASKYFQSSIDLISEKIPDAKIAFIYEDASFSSAVIAGAKAYAQQKGLDIVYENKYSKDTQDFSSYIQAAMNAGANVLLGGGHFKDGKALVGQAYNMGWHLKFIGILVAPAQPAFYDELQDAANGVTYPAQWAMGLGYSPDMAQQLGLPWAGPTEEEWLNLFNQECPDLANKPAYQAAEAGAAIVFLVEGIKAAGQIDSTAVRQAMNNLDLMTFFGHLKIDPQTGKQIGHDMVVVQWQNGEKKVVYPESVAQAEPIVPPPNWWPQSQQGGGAQQNQTTGGGAGGGAAGGEEQGGGTSTGLIVGVIIVIIIIVAAAYYFAKK